MRIGEFDTAEKVFVIAEIGNNHEGSAIFALNGAKTTLTIDFGANYAAHNIKALVTLNKTVGTSKTKTLNSCLLYTSPSPRDPKTSRMPSSA